MEREDNRLTLASTMNPYCGRPVRPLQEDLYKLVVLAFQALDEERDREAYYLIHCAYDIVSELRPGYVK